MPAKDFGLFSKRVKHAPAQRLGSTRKCQFLPSTAATLLLAAFLTLGVFADWGSNGGFFVPAANAQPKPEDVEKFKKDVQKFQEDVQKKFHTLLEKLRGSDLPDGTRENERENRGNGDRHLTQICRPARKRGRQRG